MASSNLQRGAERLFSKPQPQGSRDPAPDPLAWNDNVSRALSWTGQAEGPAMVEAAIWRVSRMWSTVALVWLASAALCLELAHRAPVVEGMD
jgi:hypothetical protein